MKEEKQGRGNLTEQIRVKALDLMGKEISVTELRLMPYLQYVLMNERKFDVCKLNNEDIGIIQEWESEGYISFETDIENKILCTKAFWDIMCEILFLGYVDID